MPPASSTARDGLRQAAVVMNLSSIYAYLDGNDEDLQKVMAGSADRSPEKQSPQDLEILGAGWLRGLDLNQRPLGYEPNELPGCSTPR